MGRLYKISCKNCKREWECRTGCGLMHGRLAFVEEAFPEEIRRAIHADRSEQSLDLFDFGYQITVCRRCGNVVSVPVLKMIEQEKLFVGLCPECGDTIHQDELWTGQPGESPDVQPGEQEVGPHVCPACQEETLSFQMTGVWD